MKHQLIINRYYRYKRAFAFYVNDKTDQVELAIALKIKSIVIMWQELLGKLK